LVGQRPAGWHHHDHHSPGDDHRASDHDDHCASDHDDHCASDHDHHCASDHDDHCAAVDHHRTVDDDHHAQEPLDLTGAHDGRRSPGPRHPCLVAVAGHRDGAGARASRWPGDRAGRAGSGPGPTSRWLTTDRAGARATSPCQ
jgi:hypothetical protein